LRSYLRSAGGTTAKTRAAEIDLGALGGHENDSGDETITWTALRDLGELQGASHSTGGDTETRRGAPLNLTPAVSKSPQDETLSNYCE